MKKTALSLGLLIICCASFTFAETQKIDERVCKGKTQNAAVSYAQQGIIFNGTCQPISDGKLVFQSPQPVTTSTEIITETTISVTSSMNEDLQIDAPILEDEQEQDDTMNNVIEEIDQPIISE